MDCFFFISFEQKQQELELQKQHALSEYHKKKASSTHEAVATPLEPSSTDHKAVLFSEYQVGAQGTHSGVVTQQNEQRDRMEQKIKEELMSNFYSDNDSTMTSSGSNRATKVITSSSSTLSPTYLQETTLNSTCLPETGPQLPPIRRLESSPIMSPSPEQKHEEQAVVTSGSGQSAVVITAPSSSFSKSKPLQLIHSDSSVEWTEYTSAMMPVSTQSSMEINKSASDNEVSLQNTDLSEFDPISSSKPSV